MKCIVCGAGGFIGWHLVKRLKEEGHYVIGLDQKCPEFEASLADEFRIVDLRQTTTTIKAISWADEIYQLAADMGGAGFVFTGENDAAIMSNSAQININVLHACRVHKIKRVFYSSSACIYPEYAQVDRDNCNLKESMAYPANPDSEYGWEKLFSERLYLAHARNYGLTVRVARYHNIFGPNGTWRGGREKAPAAICRKVAQSTNGTIDVWGSGTQTRSFLYVDDCVEGTVRLMRSDCEDVLNIGSTEMVSINKLVWLVSAIANKDIKVVHLPGPLGVQFRNSDDTLSFEKLVWRSTISLEEGLRRTYPWIAQQIANDGHISSPAYSAQDWRTGNPLNLVDK